MPGLVVPYARFLEICRRRERVLADLTHEAVTTANGDAVSARPPTIDCEAVSDKHCGTESGPTTGRAEDRAGRGYRVRPAAGLAGPTGQRGDRDAG
jgi:hypothetical protein